MLALIIGDIPTAITWTNALGLTILAAVLTALPFILWFRAIVALGAAAVIPFVLVTPVVAFILDAAISNVVPSPLQLVGVVLVMTGLIVNQSAGARAAKSTAGKPA